jgi:TPR repeat protein
LLVAVCLAVAGSGDRVSAQPRPEMSPKAAQQFASDLEKAAEGDADAAYRMGEALESGRLGGVKDSEKALRFYKQAAQKGHPDAAARIAQIESNLSLRQEKPPSPAR